MEIVTHTICTLTVLLLHETKHKRYFPTQPLSCSFQCLFELSAFSLNGHEEDIVVFFCTYFSTKLNLWERAQSGEKKVHHHQWKEKQHAKVLLPLRKQSETEVFMF